jgi:hypothetical protein
MALLAGRENYMDRNVAAVIRVPAVAAKAPTYLIRCEMSKSRSMMVCGGEKALLAAG